MKIGIITLPLHFNYGGILQNYALQKILKDMGHDPYTIEFQDTFNTPYNPIVYIKRMLKKYILRKNVKIFTEKYDRLTYPTITQYTKTFINNHIKRICYKDYKQIKPDDFGAFIIGSDQIWRPCYFPKLHISYLGFARNWNIKKIAYAPSFGSDQWEYTFSQTRRCKNNLKHFTAVSIREKEGVKLCEQNLERVPELVLDPTLLVGADIYSSLLDNYKCNERIGMFTYVLDENSWTKGFCKSIAQNKALPVYRANSKVEDPSAPLNERIQPSVEQWLYGIKNSEIVITDSFHACVFSIIFHKPFVVIVNKFRGVSRIKSLLEPLGLSKHIITEAGDFDANYDYSIPDSAYIKLASLKEPSLKYLLNSLK